MEKAASKEDFQKVLRNIAKEGLPVFRKTLQNLKLVGFSDQVSLSELAKNILRDPGLSARIVKLANSPVYNTGVFRIRSVTRAIVMLGIRNVITLAATAAFFEDVVNSRHFSSIISRLLKMLKEAEYAKQLAMAAKDPSPEEIFLADLMQNLGYLVVEAFVDRATLKEIESLVKMSDLPLEAAQKRILGISAKEVAAFLNREWQLSEIADEALSGGRKSTRGKILDFATQIENLLENNGNNSSRWQALIKEISAELHIPAQIVMSAIKQGVHNCEALEKLYKEYAYTVARTELGREKRKNEGADQSGPELSEKTSTAGHIKPATASDEVILDIFQDIIAMMYRGFTDPHLLFSLIMEGIYTGLSMDVVLFGLLSRDRKFFEIRHFLVKPDLADEVEIPEIISFKNPKVNLFYSLLREDYPLWIREKGDPVVLAKAKSAPAVSIVNIPCFIAPICPKRRTIGFVYADARKRPEHMNEQTFGIFTTLSQLAALGLSFVTSSSNQH